LNIVFLFLVILDIFIFVLDVIFEDIFTIMKKFEESGQWNLPVVEKEIYIGFLSKSSILDKYRHELLETVELKRNNNY
jgi:predicted transcriptional regulator